MTMLLDDKDAVMTRAEFESLDEYSASIPTGTPFGKIWRRHNEVRYGGDGSWQLGEYAPHANPKLVRIIWRLIHVI